MATSSSSSEMDKYLLWDNTIEPHPYLKGIYKNQFGDLLTKRLGSKEEIIDSGNKTVRSKGEYRFWNPRQCKLASALHGGLPFSKIEPGSNVLCVGFEIWNTVAHLSDIVGEVGLVYGHDIGGKKPELASPFYTRNNVQVLEKIEPATNPIVDVIYFSYFSAMLPDSLLHIAQNYLKPEGYIMFPVMATANERAISIYREIEDLLQKDNQFYPEAKVELREFKSQPILLVARFTAGRHVKRADRVERPIVRCDRYCTRTTRSELNDREHYDGQRKEKSYTFRFKGNNYRSIG